MINLDRVARNIAATGSKADVRGLADSGWVLESDYLENQMAIVGSGSGSTNNKGHYKSQQHLKVPPPPPALQPPPCTDAVKCSPSEDSIQGAYK